MSSSSPIQHPPQAQKSDEAAVKVVKAIRADAFDLFIEEQLQQTRSDDDQSEFEVVCHVY